MTTTTSVTLPIRTLLHPQSDEPPSARTTSQLAVLLIVMPPAGTNHEQRASLATLADSLQHQLADLVRVLRIDAATHPDIVRSFAVTNTPAFVLVQQGVELWRQEGVIDETTLLELVQRMLAV